MQAYSPSQTAAWLDCPVKRRLAYVERWRLRRMGRRDLAAILGRAVACGVGGFHNVLMDGRPDDRLQVARYCGDMARQFAQQELSQAIDSGHLVAETDQAQARALPDRAYRATSGYVTQCPLPDTWRLMDVERTFPDYGHCRLDLIVDDGTGPTFVDLKVKLTLEARYRQRETERYRYSWQMLHYAWVIQEVYGRTPSQYYVAFVVLEPTFATWLEPYALDPEVLRVWETSARRVWAQMAKEDAGTEDPWLNARHGDEYGPCEYMPACFDYRWDPILMTGEYVRGRD